MQLNSDHPWNWMLCFVCIKLLYITTFSVTLRFAFSLQIVEDDPVCGYSVRTWRWHLDANDWLGQTWPGIQHYIYTIDDADRSALVMCTGNLENAVARLQRQILLQRPSFSRLEGWKARWLFLQSHHNCFVKRHRPYHRSGTANDSRETRAATQESGLRRTK